MAENGLKLDIVYLPLANENCFLKYLASSYGLGPRNSPLASVVLALEASMEGNEFRELVELGGVYRAIRNAIRSGIIGTVDCKLDEPLLFAVALLALRAIGRGNQKEFVIHFRGFLLILRYLLDNPKILSDTGRILAHYIQDTLAYANNSFKMKSWDPVTSRDLFSTNNQAFEHRVQCFQLLHGKMGNNSVKLGTDDTIHLTVELVFSQLLWCVQRVFCSEGVPKIDTKVVQEVLDDTQSQLADADFQNALNDYVAELAATINGYNLLLSSYR